MSHTHDLKTDASKQIRTIIRYPLSAGDSGQQFGRKHRWGRSHEERGSRRRCYF